jgi:hypothetical protein
MPALGWLEKYWEEEPSWIKRYMRGSEINDLLAQKAGLGGAIDVKQTMWKPKAIKEFIKFMNENKQVLDKQTTFYRGTTMISPLFNPACFEMTNHTFVSTSKSIDIAKEFMGRNKKNGFLHVLVCEKGVPLYDMKDDYGENLVSREKEVLIYPGVKFTLIKKEGNKMHWSVTKGS